MAQRYSSGIRDFSGDLFFLVLISQGLILPFTQVSSPRSITLPEWRGRVCPYGTCGSYSSRKLIRIPLTSRWFLPSHREIGRTFVLGCYDFDPLADLRRINLLLEEKYAMLLFPGRDRFCSHFSIVIPSWFIPDCQDSNMSEAGV